ncbi:YSC84-related protein [Marinovum sp. 2_MG-2023]|uniref:lipid-binding SYLF domain-containing protein n=1 Tax=Roseobacteraceae TaxID=2854170 RepID=UPI001FD0444A|nr:MULTISPECIES: YSC84-related protein [Roseobacteraceae]MCJ7872269.1 YSC84-related protein [Phaeobacter sp. J2-8]MDO6729462.1 YSC84-related protein [Marinovum sp. 2_MG-2023]MDO6780385.1 YSC84-related protein [Marinovum sp. 1_MG-2023]
MTQLSRRSNVRTGRRAFVLSGLGALTLAACGNGVGSRGPATIDARVDSTLAQLYSEFPATRQVAAKSAAMMVMPLVTEAGLGLGGGYGRGALRINGATVDYYALTKLSTGLQIGAQQYAHVLFFMTDQALENFRRSPGFAAGAGVEYAIPDGGGDLSAETTTSLAPIIAVVFGQAGLRVGATLEGVKYTRIIP